MADDESRSRWSIPLALVLIGASLFGLLVVGILAAGSILSSTGPDVSVCKPTAEVVLAELMSDIRSAVRPGPVLLSRPASCGETSSGYALTEKWQVEDTAGAVEAV
jgi:hypothetical protein